MNTIIRLGIDLAKNVFSLCGVDSNDKIVLEQILKRKDLLPFLANLPSCIIAMEACTGAHHWSRQLSNMGHTPKIIDPKFVIPIGPVVRHVK